jgi:hypothetical protein
MRRVWSFFRGVFLVSLILAVIPSSGWAQPTTAGSGSFNDRVEPGAGAWKTWLLTSGSQYRSPAPPDAAATRLELGQLRVLAGQRDAAAMQQIAYWNEGDPAYRWNEIAVNEGLKSGQNVLRASRGLALLDTAIYDGMVAAWDSKYTYNRPRPAEADPSLSAALPTPASPSYPSEYAVTAGISAAVLSYLYPQDATYFSQQADAATQSRLLAGVEYPSDVQAGRVLGAKIAALAIARGRSDNTDAKWDGKMPNGPGHWTGTNPVEPMAGTWKTWVLTSGSQLRPGPPPAYNSAQEAADMVVLRNFKRTPLSNATAFYWQYADAGTNGYQYWFGQISQKLAQYHLDADPPRAARAYALLNVAANDAFVACWDAKYTYWAMRPFQYDPTWVSLFPAPNHPSYPAAHGCASGVEASVMAYLFPTDADAFTTLANQAAESRIWAGIHFPTDVTTGLALGRRVAALVIDRANHDGSGIAPAARAELADAAPTLNGASRGAIAGNHGGAFNYYQIADPTGTSLTLTMAYAPFDVGQATSVGLNVYQSGKLLGTATGQAIGSGGLATLTITPPPTDDAVVIQVFNYGSSTISYTLNPQ